MKYSKTTHPILFQYLADIQRNIDSAEISSPRVLVGLSGGVDSSVTLLALHALEYDVAALFMKNWDEDDGTEYCTAKQDLADAQAVANQLNVTLHTANFAAEYWDNVFEDFLQSYRAGFTPNPDVLCNREIKFQVFRDYATHLGFPVIATGHYARMVATQEGPELHQSVDDNKDQTYFLNGVQRDQFENVIFPLGCLPKPVVRQIAEEAKLATKQKKDSTGICFIGERRFKDFLSQYIPAQPGQICDEHGTPLGEHQGLMYYTLGQRRGIGIGGVAQSAEKPWFVARKCLETNRLFVVQDDQHPWLMSAAATLASINWISTPPNQTQTWHGFARCRHRQTLTAVSIQADQIGLTQPRIQFETPQWAVTPGQYLVLYKNGVCFGGGPVLSTC